MEKGRRLIRSYQQRIEGSIEEIFLLLCPVREKEWLEGWNYNMLYSEGGYAEKGCVFETCNEFGSYKWIITRHSVEAYEIQFVKLVHQMVVLLDIKLQEKSKEITLCNIKYTFTALNEAAAESMHIENSEERFERHMKIWEASLNHYLKNGTMLMQGENGD